ncbi:MAG: hypothetical protein A2898_03910 [Candidatus Kerfeldbacteria bacterium RIFCSPLOWO2_01_FULL_48_11]|uniref:Uncharacterized protein n=1 Tax=Candidatus Kerfeldbacteria bacterium RIFCSPLOWO2_01_FULL_48_11 TaxID=1798543 RepID=A0A1G2B6Q7_9BACT|nr:MAG: hypothetical protein UY34_C0004G0041 [Parcubacteria group bacterium GW2011_GWA2_48_9]OGY84832.1 MAG: hypothetical protein A2898_03910 [Candidatus Kerfeldbacteria bacterium RIFCSPLOWO2_01_FULL_48_11]HCM67783.1 hypothetical protein [Candidatus Kerfeldbacteria bacterium]
MQEFVHLLLPIAALIAVPTIVLYPFIVRAIHALRMRRYYCPTCFIVVIAKEPPACSECSDIVPTEMLPAEREHLAYYGEMHRITSGTDIDDEVERHSSTLHVEVGQGMQVCPKCFRIEYGERLRDCPDCAYTPMGWADPDDLEHYRRMQSKLGMS